jgi:hypothetical protein
MAMKLRANSDLAELLHMFSMWGGRSRYTLGKMTAQL